MTSKENVEPSEVVNNIHSVQIKQEDCEDFKFVISEVLFIESETESENDIQHVQVPTSSSITETPEQMPPMASNGSKINNTECNTTNQYSHPRSSSEQGINQLPPRHDFHGPFELSGDAMEVCEASLIDSNEVDINEKDKGQSRNFPRRTRKPTQKMIENVCRLCEQHSYGLIKIFGAKGNQLQLVERIHLHLPIQVRKDDKLPLGVCASCAEALKICHDLYVNSLTADGHLRQIFLKEDSAKFFSLEVNSFETSTKIKTSYVTQDTQKAGSLHEKSSVNLQAVVRPGCTDQKDDVNDETNTVTDILEQSADGESADGESEGGVSADEELEDRHDSDETTLDPFEPVENACDLCQEVFESKLKLSKHRKSHSAEERLKCEVCGKTMPNDQSFHTHIKIHRGNVHQCPTCGKNLANKHSLNQHLLVHEPPKFCCQICGITCRTRYKLASHMAFHSDERPFQCSVCSQTFKLKETLRQHKAIHSQSPSYICDLCGYTVHRKSHLTLHKKTSHKNGDDSIPVIKHPCDLCNMKFIKKHNLIRHQVAAHNAKPSKIIGKNHDGESTTESQENVFPIDLLCVYCNIQFLDKETFRSHKKDGHGTPLSGSSYKSRRHECSHCGQTLNSKRSWERHIRLHTGERPFLCKICGEGFISSETALCHERKHVNLRPYKCDLCDKAFFSYTTLYQHKQIHVPRKMYQCDLCKYQSCRSAALRIHLRIHTGEKPYACKLCDKSYKSSWDLKLHNRVHTGEPPIKRLRSKPNQTKVDRDAALEDAESSNSTSYQETLSVF